MPPPPGEESWPELELAAWRGTRDALHLWTQVVGKSLLACCEPQSHWWHTALRVSARGLAGAVPLQAGDERLDVEVDLVDHVVVVRGERRTMAVPLVPRSVRSFYEEYLAVLRACGVALRPWPMPVELPDAVPLDQDDAPRPYDAAAAHRFWRVLRRMDAVLRDLAGEFVGKQSPVHFFWGSFDLAAARFSGRRAPERPGADPVTREAYSHEVISFGFWPGGVTPARVAVDEPVLYAYAAPEPPGFREAPVRGPSARYDGALGEFLLPYAALRAAADPAAEARAFWRDAYQAGATRGAWDRDALERRPAAYSMSNAR